MQNMLRLRTYLEELLRGEWVRDEPIPGQGECFHVHLPHSTRVKVGRVSGRVETGRCTDPKEPTLTLPAQSAKPCRRSLAKH